MSLQPSTPAVCSPISSLTIWHCIVLWSSCEIWLRCILELAHCSTSGILLTFRLLSFELLQDSVTTERRGRRYHVVDRFPLHSNLVSLPNSIQKRYCKPETWTVDAVQRLVNGFNIAKERLRDEIGSETTWRKAKRQLRRVKWWHPKLVAPEILLQVLWR